MRVDAPLDPRFAPFERLRSIIPLPAEKESDKRLLHRADLKRAVQK